MWPLIFGEKTAQLRRCADGLEARAGFEPVSAIGRT
jgi:hypothetical protein